MNNWNDISNIEEAKINAVAITGRSGLPSVVLPYIEVRFTDPTGRLATVSITALNISQARLLYAKLGDAIEDYKTQQ